MSTTVTDRLKEQSKQRTRKTPEQQAAEKARKAKNAKAKAPKEKAPKADAPRLTRKGHSYTTAWTGKTGEIKKGDVVRTEAKDEGKVDARFTIERDGERIPYVCIKPVHGGGKGKHVPAATCSHVKTKAKAAAKAPDLKGALATALHDQQGKSAYENAKDAVDQAEMQPDRQRHSREPFEAATGHLCGFYRPLGLVV